jgi:hypothetical protein
MRGLAFTALILLAGCASQPQTTVAGHGLSLTLPKGAYTKAQVKVLPRHVEVPDEVPVDVGPRRWEVVLPHTPRTSMKVGGPRYYYPAGSDVFVTPLQDASVPSYAVAYPEWAKSARELRALLAVPQPEDLAARLPGEPFNDAGRALNAKVRRIETPTLTGYRVLCYYRQGTAGYGATNAELTYDFQGLTKDGRYYVSARLAVRNDRLPDSIDDPRAKSGETVAESAAERKRIDSWSEDSFFPTLHALDGMMESLRVK